VHEPRPAGAELADAGLLELGLEVVERAERGVVASASAPSGSPPPSGLILLQNSDVL
jgi:hypothetical protein